jgi:hypothetical protein
MSTPRPDDKLQYNTILSGYLLDPISILMLTDQTDGCESRLDAGMYSTEHVQENIKYYYSPIPFPCALTGQLRVA